MIERTAEARISENKLTPEYWDGHAPDDICPLPDIHPDRRKLTPEEVRKFQDTWARKQAKEFLASSDIEIFRVFTEKGEVFDPHVFPEGTVIRIAREQLNRDNLVVDGVIFKATEHLGLVLPENAGLVLFPIFQNKPKLGQLQYEDDIVMIGSVEHFREELLFTLDKPKTFVRRNTKVELLQYGKKPLGKRKRINSISVFRPTPQLLVNQ